jgi:hypothetical protein
MVWLKGHEAVFLANIAIEHEAKQEQSVKRSECAATLLTVVLGK